MDQIHLEGLSRHRKNMIVVENSDQGVIKNKSCLINLFAFYDEIPGPPLKVEKWKLYTLTLIGSLMWSYIESLQTN